MIVTVHVKAKAREEKIEWLDQDTAKISVTAAPVKGKANAAVLKVLAKDMGVSPSSVELIRGATAKMKQFEIKTRP